jgi:hypothetical protein
MSRGEFWGISAVFVPATTPHVLANLLAFSEGVRRQGLPLLIVELAFGDQPFFVPEAAADRIVRLRTSTVLWHKERLLNLGLRHLPQECRFVAWLDADVLFENEQWVAATRERLEHAAVVQPFEAACWLPEGATSAPDHLPDGHFAEGHLEGHQVASMAAVLDRTENRRRVLAVYDQHGHTGFAWAARRDLLDRHGLYDRAILGGGDLVNAHAFAADTDFLRGRHMFLRLLTPEERTAIGAWGTGVAQETGGRIGWTPGRVLHLHHGPLANRKYVERFGILRDARFDPHRDIAPDADGCWRWNSDKPELHQRVFDYFVSRVTTAAVGHAVDTMLAPNG